MTARHRNLLRSTPFLELIVSAIIIILVAAIAARPRVTSDALFLTGMSLVVVGTVIVGSVELFFIPISVGKITSGSGSSRTKREMGIRIILVGSILVTAAVVIGEMTRLL